MADVTVDVVSERVVEVGAVAATDQQVAGLVGAPGSATATALNSTYESRTVPSYVAGRAGAFDSRRSLYLPNGTALETVRSVLADATASAVRLQCIGDSITFGFRSTPQQWGGSYPERLRRMLASIYGETGTGFVHLTDFSHDTRIATVGTWTRQAGNLGLFGYSCWRAVGTAQTRTFTPTVPIDSFNVYYLKSNGGGTFTVSVDGGAPVGVNSNAGGAGTSVAVYNVSAGTLGTHSVTVAGAPTGDLYLLGFEGVRGTTGVRVSNASKGGGKYTDLVFPSAPTAAGGSLQVAFDLATPQLTLFAFGMNEYIQSSTTADYKTQAQTAINRAVAAGSKVMLLTAVPNSDQTRTPTQASYASAVMDLADTNGIPVLDMGHRWTSFTASSPYYFPTDGVHPGNGGYHDMARAVFDALVG